MKPAGLVHVPYSTGSCIVSGVRVTIAVWHYTNLLGMFSSHFLLVFELSSCSPDFCLM